MLWIMYIPRIANPISKPTLFLAGIRSYITYMPVYLNLQLISGNGLHQRRIDKRDISAAEFRTTLQLDLFRNRRVPTTAYISFKCRYYFSSTKNKIRALLFQSRCRFHKCPCANYLHRPSEIFFSYPRQTADIFILPSLSLPVKAFDIN